MYRNEFTPYGWPEPGAQYLAATAFLDFEEESVARFADHAVAGRRSERERAVALFYAVRDGICYDPYHLRPGPQTYRASTVLREGRAFCIPKAVLLVAAARRAGIASAIGLSDVVNHLSTPKLKEAMGGRDVFMHHGWAALHVEGRWVKAVPAFNAELCAVMRVPPTDFDGTQDAVLQAFTEDGTLQMSYLKDHGVWADVPFHRIDEELRGYYPSRMWSDVPRREFGKE